MRPFNFELEISRLCEAIIASEVYTYSFLFKYDTFEAIMASNSLEFTSSKFPKSSIVRDPLWGFQFSLGPSLAFEVSEILLRA